MGCIYKITNKVNGKIYIGQTQDDTGKSRINSHLNGNGSRLIRDELDVYGIGHFEYNILESHDNLDLNEREIYYIRYYDCINPKGYNLHHGGNCHNRLSEKLHTCPRCGYKTQQKHNFIKHLFQRKEICEPLIADVSLEKEKEELLDNTPKTYPCAKCDKSFATRSGLVYHKNICAENNKFQALRKEIESLRHRVDVLQQEKYSETTSSASTSHSSQRQAVSGENNQITLNNVTININTFGKENKDYITVEFARECFNMGVLGIQKMLDVIYFNDDHPENHNVRLRSLKNSLVEVMQDDKWVCGGLKDTIDTMISNSSSHIIANAADVCIKQPTSDNIANANAIANIQPGEKRRFREIILSQLVERKDKKK